MTPLVDPFKSFVGIGALTFAGAKYVFDCSTEKSVLIGIAVGLVAYLIASQKPVALPPPQ